MFSKIVRYLGPLFERSHVRPLFFSRVVFKMSSRSTRSSSRNRQSNRLIRTAHRRRYPEPRVVSFLPKEHYKTRTTNSGLLILSKRKHAFLTEEEKEKRRGYYYYCCQEANKKRHKSKKEIEYSFVVSSQSLWEHGC